MPQELLLCEEAKTATKTPTGRWRAILAVPGKGSSGNYSREMLAEYGPKAFPAGMKAYLTHDEKRDPRDLLGHYPDGAWFDPDEGVDGALVSELEPLPSKRAFVEEVAPHVALSLFAMGKKDDAGNITELLAHRTNGVDMVGYGGLEGSSLGSQIFERAQTLLEASRTAETVSSVEKENSMTPEQIAALVEGLKGAFAESLAPVLTFVTEQRAAEEARRQAETANKDAEPTVKEAVAKALADKKAIDDAELSESASARLLAASENGDDITEALAEAIKVRDEYASRITESTEVTGGRRSETTTTHVAESYSVGLFSK
ncbi:hypothetical protein [Pseudolysinimonas sp.]|uniref:hypothetical protein n=1 Tax=Pseudolysinimonas sp. TaxID=2680009 RepID=UPI003F81E5D6